MNVLPIGKFKAEIMAALQEHRVVILVGETGSGKSTQIGQYLLEMGETVLITQPRRAATKSLAARVAQEMGCELGTTVGYRMMGAGKSGPDTDLLFATDGLTLVRELMGNSPFSHLVLDEVHEWGLNVETLLAWSKRRMTQDDFRLVVMSATLNAEPLRRYFGDDAVIINVPGRCFPVKQRQSDRSTATEAIELLKRGKDVLVFEPGKGEINATMEKIVGSGVNAEVLPFYAELEDDAQAACLQEYGRPKCVVATTIAQTSLTLPGVVVVDSGSERNTSVERSNEGFGVESLVLRHAAQDTLRQRSGRSGRTEAGEYVLCSSVPFEERPEYGRPEIQRSMLETVMLRLKLAGLDMEELDFFHAPSPAAVAQARRTLYALGAFDSEGNLTKTGRLMAKLPVGPRTSRMLIEAARRGVLTEMITIAAIIEKDGIVERNNPAWRKLAGGETASDPLAQFNAWHELEKMRITSSDDLRKAGMHVKAYYQARELRRRIAEAARGLHKVKRVSSSQNKPETLRQCIAAGMPDLAYKRDYRRFTRHSDSRILSRASVLPSSTEWAVGVPRNIGTKSLLTMATAVEPQWLVDVAPHLAKIRTGVLPRYNEGAGDVVSTTETWLDDHLVRRVTVLDRTHPKANQLRREYDHDRQWNLWQKPEEALPNFADPTVPLPETTTFGYGTDSVTGERLLAYRGVSYSSQERRFVFTWTRTLAYAEECTLRARSTAEQLQQAAVSRPLVETEAITLRNRANQLRCEEEDRETYLLSEDDYERLVGHDIDDRALGRLTIEELRKWCESAASAIAAAEKAVERGQRPEVTYGDLQELAALINVRT